MPIWFHKVYLPSFIQYKDFESQLQGQLNFSTRLIGRVERLIRLVVTNLY
jgi:hypothetical protein